MTLASRYTRPLAVTAPKSAVEIGIAMPHSDPKANSNSRAPMPSPTSSAWLAHQLTGLFHVSATGPPIAVETPAARVSASARSICDHGLV